MCHETHSGGHRARLCTSEQHNYNTRRQPPTRNRQQPTTREGVEGCRGLWRVRRGLWMLRVGHGLPVLSVAAMWLALGTYDGHHRHRPALSAGSRITVTHTSSTRRVHMIHRPGCARGTGTQSTARPVLRGGTVYHHTVPHSTTHSTGVPHQCCASVHSTSARALLSGWVGQRPKKVCVPKIGLKFPAALINFIFCRRKFFLMWAGGGGSAGAGQGPKQSPPSPPPPPGSLSIGLTSAPAVW